MEVSRQLKWQRKQRALGNCTTCGKKSAENKNLCADCNIKRREYMRKKFGYNPKQKGKAGRPIKYGNPLSHEVHKVDELEVNKIAVPLSIMKGKVCM